MTMVTSFVLTQEDARKIFYKYDWAYSSSLDGSPILNINRYGEKVLDTNKEEFHRQLPILLDGMNAVISDAQQKLDYLRQNASDKPLVLDTPNLTYKDDSVEKGFSTEYDVHSLVISKNSIDAVRTDGTKEVLLNSQYGWQRFPETEALFDGLSKYFTDARMTEYAHKLKHRQQWQEENTAALTQIVTDYTANKSNTADENLAKLGNHYYAFGEDAVKMAMLSGKPLWLGITKDGDTQVFVTKGLLVGDKVNLFKVDGFVQGLHPSPLNEGLRNKDTIQDVRLFKTREGDFAIGATLNDGSRESSIIDSKVGYELMKQPNGLLKEAHLLTLAAQHLSVGMKNQPNKEHGLRY